MKKNATREALEASRLAMEIWTHQCAPEFCDEALVRRYQDIRFKMGGTLGVIATTTAAIDSAMRRRKRGKP